jgi:hypothetical protein
MIAKTVLAISGFLILVFVWMVDSGGFGALLMN